MRIVAAAMPVRSATSLMASPFTTCPMILRQRVERFLPGTWLRYGPGAARDRIRGASGYVPGAMSRDPDPSLVTGASGYVGGFLVEELVRRGRRVRALARDPRRVSLPPRGAGRAGRRRHRPGPGGGRWGPPRRLTPPPPGGARAGGPPAATAR